MNVLEGLVVTGFASVMVGALLLLWRRRAPSSKAVKSEEVPIERVPGRIEYEIVQQKEERTIVLKRGRIGRKKQFYDWTRTNPPRRFFPNHIIKETLANGKVRYFIRWNVNYSEAQDLYGEYLYSPELENLDMNDMVIQLKKAVGVIQGFVLDRNMQMILLMAMVFGIPIGLSFNDIFHWVPNTVVHWVRG